MAKLSAVVVAVLTLALPACLSAQSTGCEGCSVRRILVATIGGPQVPVSIEPPIFRLSDGRLVSLIADRTRFVEFTAAGDFVRTVGGRGGAPGVLFRPGASAVSRGDTIVIHQPGRLDVFSPQLGHVRSIRVPDPPGGVAGLFTLANGEFVSFYGRRSDFDFLTLLGPDGSLLRSFGAAVLPHDPNCSLCQVRLFTSGASPNELTAAPPNEYAIERWSVDGKLIERVAISSPWFPPGRTSIAPTGARPNPILHGVSRDSAGRLWVVGLVANDRWKPPAPTTPAGYVAGVPVPARGESALDLIGYTTVVDVLDPSGGRVLATARFDGESDDVLPGGYVVRRRQNADGIAVFDVFRLELQRGR